MARTDHGYDDILNSLRARIFRAPFGKDLVLHETEIASEFGLSRTPIRQMFQTLVAERLLETRVGVGSVSPKLDIAARPGDFDVYAQITLAASRLKGNVITSQARMHLAGLHHLVVTSTRRDEAFFVDLSVQSANAVADIIQNPILSDAFKAARWQMIRWRVVDMRSDPDMFWDKTISIMARISQAAENDDPALLLEIAAGIIAGLSTPLEQKA